MENSGWSHAQPSSLLIRGKAKECPNTSTRAAAQRSRLLGYRGRNRNLIRNYESLRQEAPPNRRRPTLLDRTTAAERNQARATLSVARACCSGTGIELSGRPHVGPGLEREGRSDRGS
jgi:hypothetical protein